jgi:hypothetical protein
MRSYSDCEKIEIVYTVDGKRQRILAPVEDDGSMLRRDFSTSMPFYMHEIPYDNGSTERSWAFAPPPCNCGPCDENDEKLLETFIENDILRPTWIPLSKIRARQRLRLVVEYTQCEYDQLGSAQVGTIKI